MIDVAYQAFKVIFWNNFFDGLTGMGMLLMLCCYIYFDIYCLNLNFLNHFFSKSTSVGAVEQGIGRKWNYSTVGKDKLMR